jgi:dihydrofolate reductase
MRQIRYGVAMSLDGYIADADGGFDWIVMDPDIDFVAMMARYDTLLMGRRTYEVTQAMGGGGGDPMAGVRTIVVSRTLQQRDHPDVTVVSENWEDTVRELREKPGKDIWLFGGGVLFAAMLDAGLVDGLDVGVIPVLLGGGIPFLKPPAKRAKLELRSHKLYPKSGIVTLEYDVVRAGQPKAARSRKGRTRQPRGR